MISNTNYKSKQLRSNVGIIVLEGIKATPILNEW